MASTPERHAIRNSVIAGLLLAIILGSWSYLSIVFGWLGDAVSWVGGVLAYQVPLPVWLLILIGLVSLPAIVFLIFWLFPLNPWRRYTQDRFEGMIWRWQYDSNDRPTNLVAYCPSDDTSLLWTSAEWGDTVNVLCETCGKNYGALFGDIRDVQERIERQIDRKLRTGKWKSVVDRQKHDNTHVLEN